MQRCIKFGLAILTLLLIGQSSFAADPWVTYEGKEGPGKGKHIVLIAGDEEYRSEEALPQLGKILSQRHGFKCTILFSINPSSGNIDPNFVRNTPGLEALTTADLMIIATRFRILPDEQMQHIDNYLKSGGAVMGLRTATHAFNPTDKDGWQHYANGYNGDKKEWTDGFGRVVLGEKWISHHGSHKHESTLGLIDDGAKGLPVLRGIKDGDVWGATDVYGVRLPLPGDSKPLILGQVMKRAGDYDETDIFYGMRHDDSEAVEGEKNTPMMPVAWTKTYQVPDGKKGQVFTTTLGSSSDLLIEGTRRLIVNGVYWATGLAAAIPEEGTNVDLVGEYNPTQFGFHDNKSWRDRKMTVDELHLD